jgi:hypothetical protein
MPTLQYYFEDGRHVIFDKYMIKNGVISNKRTGITLNHHKSGKYNVCNVIDDNGKSYVIRMCRAVASTIHGPPPTIRHTADHIDRNTWNDSDDNIRWLCKRGQSENQVRPETLKSAFVIVRDGVEKTAKEWANHLKDEKNVYGNNYTIHSIKRYTQTKMFGFSYKEYSDLQGEIWKEITGSKNSNGKWEISNMNRVKYITKLAENVFSGDRLDRRGGYPKIFINGKTWYCHILAFKTFYPDEYAAKKTDEMVLHEDDDKLDFRPHKLRLGTRSENTNDAHINGKYNSTKSERKRCASYIDGVFEKEYESRGDAVRYLKNIGHIKANKGNIGSAISGGLKTAYGRTWNVLNNLL